VFDTGIAAVDTVGRRIVAVAVAAAGDTARGVIVVATSAATAAADTVAGTATAVASDAPGAAIEPAAGAATAPAVAGKSSAAATEAAAGRLGRRAWLAAEAVEWNAAILDVMDGAVPGGVEAQAVMLEEAPVGAGPLPEPNPVSRSLR
jgi:hypothetical protein